MKKPVFPHLSRLRYASVAMADKPAKTFNIAQVLNTVSIDTGFMLNVWRGLLLALQRHVAALPVLFVS